MADQDKDKDVKDGSSASSDADKDKSKPQGGTEDDKDKNFAALRQQLSEKDAEIARLKQQAPPEKEDKPKEPTEAERVAFDRDFREVSIRFVSKHKLTQEQLKTLAAEVSFTGAEVQSEIESKLTRAYEALPEVKAAREKQLKEEGRREAMQNFQDEELDIGGGGDVDLGGGSDGPRFNTKERGFMDAMGVPKEARKGINKDENPNVWTEGKSPTRKFFEPRTQADKE